MVDMPLMTNNGTFIVNGTERVIGRCTAAPAFSLTMTVARRTLRVNIFSLPASFLTAVPGLISNSMRKTICMSVSTAAVNCP